VEYAELVNGKYVIDQRVPASRLTLMTETERKALVRQQKAWAKDLQQMPNSAWTVAPRKRATSKGKNRVVQAAATQPQSDAMSSSASVAASDITTTTTTSMRPRRASAATAAANMMMITGDQMDQILDEVEEEERAAAEEKTGSSKQAGAGTSASGSSSSAGKGKQQGGKAALAREVGGGDVNNNEQHMLEADVDMEELMEEEEGGREREGTALPLSGLSAKDFIARLLKRTDTSGSRKSRSREEEGDGSDVEREEQEEEEQEGGCVFSPQEVVQLNELLTAKQVHLMLQAIHSKSNRAASSSSLKEAPASTTVKGATAAASSSSSSSDSTESKEQQEVPPSQSQEGGSQVAGLEGGDNDTMLMETALGENSCRVLATQLCAFIANGELKADIQKAYLAVLPENKDASDIDLGDELPSSFGFGGGGRGSSSGSKSSAAAAARGRKAAALAGQVVDTNAEHHPVQWLKSTKEGGQLLLRNRAVLSAAACLLRILATSALISSVEVTAGADKAVERALVAVTDFLRVNFGSMSWSQKPGSLGRRFRPMDEQLMMVVIRTTGFACLPLIRSVMGAAQTLLSARTQTSSVCSAAVRLAFAAMGADPHCSANAACLEFVSAARSGPGAGRRVSAASNAAAAQVQAQVASATAPKASASATADTAVSRGGKEDAAVVARGNQMSPLLALHSGARSLLQCIGQHYPASRSHIVVDVLQLLSAVYVGDDETSHRKLRGQYQVHHSAPPAAAAAASAIGFTGNPRFVTDALALLLSFIQAAGVSINSANISGSAVSSSTHVVGTSIAEDEEQERLRAAVAASKSGRAAGGKKAGTGGKKGTKRGGKGKGKSKGKAEVQEEEEEEDSYYSNLRKTGKGGVSGGLASGDSSSPSARAATMRGLESNPHTEGPVKLCRLFVKELMDRCETPELCSEYREVCLSLLQELAVALPSPVFPCAGVLLDLLRVRVSAVLTSEHTGVTENRPATDPQCQLIVFYMEVLGRMATLQRCIERATRDQDNLAARYGLCDSSSGGSKCAAPVAAATADFNSNVLRAFKDKVARGEEMWLRRLGVSTAGAAPVVAVAVTDASATDAATTTSTRTTRSRGNTAVKKASRDNEDDDDDSASMQVAEEDTAVRAAAMQLRLGVLEGLCAIAVDAVSEYLTPSQCTSAEYVDRHFALCAHPLALLKLVGAGASGSPGSGLLQALEGVRTLDLHQHLVCEYMRKRVLSARSGRHDTSLSSSSSSIHGMAGAMATMSRGDGEADCAFSAFHMLLALWQRDVLIEENEAEGSSTSAMLEAVAACAGLGLAAAHALADGGASSTTGGSSTAVATTGSGTMSSPGGGSSSSSSTDGERTRAALEQPSRQLHTLHSWIQSRYGALTTRRFVKQQAAYLIDMLLRLIGQPAAGVRVKSIKTFGRLFAVDPTVMHANPEIRRAVAERLGDVEIRVREEATKVTGQSLLSGSGSASASASAFRGTTTAQQTGQGQGQEEQQGEQDSEPVVTLQVDEYIDPLLLCLADKGASVRRAAVTVLRDILLNTSQHPRYAEICLALAERARAEEGTPLRDSIRACFQQLWFTRSGQQQQQQQQRRKCSFTYCVSATEVDAAAMSNGVSLGPEFNFGGAEEAKQGADNVHGGGEESKDMTETVTLTHPEEVAAHIVEVMALMEPLRQSDGGTDQGGGSGSGSGSGSSSSTIHVYLSELVKELTHGQFSALAENGEATGAVAEAEGGPKVSKAALAGAKKQFQDVTSALVEFLVRLEERDPAILARLRCVGAGRMVHPSSSSGSGNSSSSSFVSHHHQGQGHEHQDYGWYTEQELLVACVAGLQLMCTAMPALLTGKIATLLPYLQQHSQLSPPQQALVARRVMDITSAVVGSLGGVRAAAAVSVSSIYEAATCTNHGGPSLVDSTVARSLPGISFSGLLNDLKDIIFRAPAMSNVNAAIRCMATVTSHVVDDAAHYMLIGSKCFNAVMAVARGARNQQQQVGGLITVSGQPLAQLQRALVVLGALCEHSRLCYPQLLKMAFANGASTETLAAASAAAASGDDERLATCIRELEESTARLPLAEGGRGVSPLTINGSCYRAAVFALSVDDVGVQTRAVQALCQSFVGCPRLAFAARNCGLFGTLMDPVNRPEIFMEKFLVSMNSVMVIDETRTNRLAASAPNQQEGQQQDGGSNKAKQQTKIQGQGKDVMAMMMADDGGNEDEDEDEEEDEEDWTEVGQSVLTASAHDSDTTAAGAVCVQHKDQLLALLAHRDLWLRLAALRLVATLLRQGILCPLDAVSHLVCLQSDSDPTLRREALEVVLLGDQKHPTFLDNRVVSGLEMAFDSQAEQVRQERLAMADSDSPAAQWEAAHSPITAADISPTVLIGGSFDGMGGASVTGDMGAGTVVSLFGELYRQCFQGGGKRRYSAFLLSVLRCIQRLCTDMKTIRARLVDEAKIACDPRTKNSSKGRAARVALQPANVDAALARLSHASGSAQYLMSVLAHLPYENLNEPLQVISHIRRHTAVDTALINDEVVAAVAALTTGPTDDDAAVTAAAPAAAIVGEENIGPNHHQQLSAAVAVNAGAMVTPDAKQGAATAALASGMIPTPASFLKWTGGDEHDATPHHTAITATTTTATYSVSSAAGSKRKAASSRGGSKRGGKAVVAAGKGKKAAAAGKAKSKAATRESKRRRTATEEGAEADEDEDEGDDEKANDSDSDASVLSDVSSLSHGPSLGRHAFPHQQVHPTSNPNSNSAADGRTGPLALDESQFLRWVDSFCRVQQQQLQTAAAAAGATSTAVGVALREEHGSSTPAAGQVKRTSPPVHTGATSEMKEGGGGEDNETGATRGLATAAVVLMGGEEARIREALMLLRQWLMRVYRLSEDRCAQYDASGNAAARSRTARDAANASSKEAGSLLVGRGATPEEWQGLSFEAYLSGAASVPSFGYGSNIHVAAVSPAAAGGDSAPGSPAVLEMPPFSAAVGIGIGIGSGTPDGADGDPSCSMVPHHSCIFTTLARSPQSALQAVRSSLGSIGKMASLATTQTVPVGNKRARVR
jgi:hypothetical protein